MLLFFRMPSVRIVIMWCISSGWLNLLAFVELYLWFTSNLFANSPTCSFHTYLIIRTAIGVFGLYSSRRVLIFALPNTFVKHWYNLWRMIAGGYINSRGLIRCQRSTIKSVPRYHLSIRLVMRPIGVIIDYCNLGMHWDEICFPCSFHCYFLFLFAILVTLLRFICFAVSSSLLFSFLSINFHYVHSWRIPRKTWLKTLLECGQASSLLTWDPEVLVAAVEL